MNPSKNVNPSENTAATTGTPGVAAPEKVGIAEIAAFCRQLRELSRPADPARPAPDQAAARAAFLTRKADLFARIAAQHPDLTPPAPSPADGGPA